MANRPMSGGDLIGPVTANGLQNGPAVSTVNKLSCGSFPPAFHSRRSIFSFHRFWHRSWMFAPARASSTWREQRSRYNAATFGLQLSKPPAAGPVPLAKLRLISPSPAFPQSEPRRARSAHPGIVNPLKCLTLSDRQPTWLGTFSGSRLLTLFHPTWWNGSLRFDLFFENRRCG